MRGGVVLFWEKWTKWTKRVVAVFLLIFIVLMKLAEKVNSRWSWGLRILSIFSLFISCVAVFERHDEKMEEKYQANEPARGRSRKY